MQSTSIYERFDEYDLEQTVETLRIVNPDNAMGPNEIKAIVSSNVTDEEKPSVISTGGWVASNYRDHEGIIKWRVSLCAYVVNRYLNE